MRRRDRITLDGIAHHRSVGVRSQTGGLNANAQVGRVSAARLPLQLRAESRRV